ncbi:MAG: DUF6777 domain-containing protein [Pseudonocardia sp.]
MGEETFGPYRIESLIGRGGMGEVHRAYDTRRDRIVALKRLPTALAQDEDFRARFRKEASVAARLHEPHIVPIHDFGEIDGVLFIDMRLVEGEDLAALLKRQGALPPGRAVNIVAQVAAALDVAHEQGLVHRDIKPANILVTPASTGADEFVYVADFGIARSFASGSTSLTATGATVGSVDYMAPERFASGLGDRRVDVYSLGCVLFEALTGRRPFDVAGLPAIINAHLNVPPPRPTELAADLPAGFDAVVARALAKDPADRYATAGELAAAARAAAGDVRFTGPTVAAHSPHTGPTVLHTGPTVAAHSPHTGPTVANPPAGSWQPAYGPPRGNAPGAPYPPGPVPPWPNRGTGPATIVGPPRRRSAGVLVALGAVVAALTLLTTAIVVFGNPLSADASTVRRDPVLTPGDNPFMPAVGRDRSGVVAPAGVGRTVDGATVGLYGGTRNDAVCDPGQLVAFLESDPAKAAAWAQVQGIDPGDIRDYVAGLTPVILRSDTAVTNHGFSGGRATVVPAVLQAGTAVLVDRYGVPRARCACGNPLTPAYLPATPTYTGPTWTGFSNTQITTIVSSTTVIVDFTLVDLATQEAFTRPAGTGGDQDGAQQTQQPLPTQPLPTQPLPTQPPLQETRTPLYNLVSGTNAAGASGSRADPSVTGVAGESNTSFWVGCDGAPAQTAFQLSGDFSRVDGRIALAAFTPSDLTVAVQLLGDGVPLDSVSLTAGQTYDFALATTGVASFTVAAQAVSGTCTPAPVGYGVLADAAAVS